jgi:hypothetical protein
VGGAGKHPQRHDEGRIKLVQVPAQPLVRVPALVDQIVAMIDQQLDLAIRLLAWPRPREISLAQRCAYHRVEIQIRLAVKLSRMRNTVARTAGPARDPR